MPPVSELTIRRTPPEHRAQALSAATGQAVSAVAGFERRAADRGMDLSLVWSAYTQDGALQASILLVPSPGRTAAVMFGLHAGQGYAPVVGRLLQQAAHDLSTEGSVALLQALPRPSESIRRRALEAGGFQRLATLEYMERPNSVQAPTHELPAGFTLRPWHTHERTMMIALLQRTFVNTLDCPGLAAMRTGDDILDGHLHAGDSDTRLWRVIWHHETAVGAVLLSPCALTDSVDLVYLGLAPEVRGKGVALAALQHALHEASALPHRLVQLAVDTRNAPAVTLYQRAGFQGRQQREAWVRPLSSGTTCPQHVDTAL